jgi:excisionase family DNA binding protein
LTDSLGAPSGGVPRHLFELDELQDEKALDAVVVNMPASGKRAKRHNGQDLHPAAARPPRKSTTTHGEGPVLLLSVEEAARSLSIGRSKTYELIAEGLLETVHIGRSTRVPVAALHDLLDRLREVGDHH